MRIKNNYEPKILYTLTINNEIMSENIFLKILNTGEKIETPQGVSLLSIAKKIGESRKYFGAYVNNRVKSLSYEVFKPKQIQFIDYSDPEGQRMYFRSLFFVLMRATENLFPEAKLSIEFSVSKGYYCNISGQKSEFVIDDIFAIGEEMRRIISLDLPFVRSEITTDKALSLFASKGYYEKIKVLESSGKIFTPIYTLDGMQDFFYGELVPSTGYLKLFDLVKYYSGMLLRVPLSQNKDEMSGIVLQNTMYDVFLENREWLNIIGVKGIGSLNIAIEQRDIDEYIKISEALHEKKVAYIADEIGKNKNKKIILISGPSSSGKTTFAKRLAIQLKVLGIKPVNISLDNYFVDRDKTPLDENGEYDFESINSLDVKFFNSNLVDLLDGKEVLLPKFSFETGERFFDGEKLKMTDNSVLVIEGIHGLNPMLTPSVSSDNKYKIYVSALTAISMDGHNRIPTTDNRLIRRIVRDFKYRNYSAQNTIKRWPSVRRGEDKYIFPYQEEADIMFNSALFYEIGVLKKFVEPMLLSVPETCVEYREAYRLLNFLSYISPISTDQIPSTSILREFLGGSGFEY